MVKVVEKSKGLRLKKEHVAPQKRPAICLAFLGVILTLSGAMLVGIDFSMNYSDVALKTGGAFLIIFGVAALAGGFTYKYIVHHRLKDKRREVYMVSTPSEHSRCTTPVERIQIPLDRRRSSAFRNGGLVLGVGYNNLACLGPQSSYDPDNLPPGSARVHRKVRHDTRRGSRSAENSPDCVRTKVGFKLDDDVNQFRRVSSSSSASDEGRGAASQRSESLTPEPDSRPPGSARVHRKERLGVPRGARSVETSPDGARHKVRLQIDNDIDRHRRVRSSSSSRGKGASPSSLGNQSDLDDDDPDAITPC